MSKSGSGLFSGTSGEKKTYSYDAREPIMHRDITTWAHEQRNTLSGKARESFNTACVAYDSATGKSYYGRNGGYRAEGYVKNPILYGDATHLGLLPKESLNKYPIGNCAEVIAINNALNAGATLDNIHITTIHTTKKKFGTYKESCENCSYAFKGKIKKNYSGWIEGD